MLPGEKGSLNFSKDIPTVSETRAGTPEIPEGKAAKAWGLRLHSAVGGKGKP